MGGCEGVFFSIRVKTIDDKNVKISILNNGKTSDVILPYRNIDDLIDILKENKKRKKIKNEKMFCV